MDKKNAAAIVILSLVVIFLSAIWIFAAADFMTISASSSGAGHTPQRAFDGNTKADDFWEAETGGFPQWIQLSYAEKAMIVKYELQAGELELDRMPKDWEFQGSNDGSAWQKLDERKNQSGWKPYESRSYKVANPAAYPYYRFYLIAGNAPLVRVYEIKVVQ